MFFNTNFTFAGEDSEATYGLKLVRMTGGMIEQTFSGSRKVIEDNSENWDKPIFYGTSQSPLTFEVTLSKEGVWTFSERVEITNWLVQNEYKDFEPADYPVIFKAIAIGQPTFYNNGLDEGYLNIEFRCDGPNVYEPEVETIRDLPDNTTGYNLDIDNTSNLDKPYYPEIEATILTGETGFSIENQTNGSRIEMTGLTEGETIYIDCKKKIIISDLNTNRVPNLLNLEFLFLDSGINSLLINGLITLKIRTQFPIRV